MNKLLIRDSLSAGPYSKITIFGPGTHSHVIENLKQGRRFDIKVIEFHFISGQDPFHFDVDPDPGSALKINGSKSRSNPGFLRYTDFFTERIHSRTRIYLGPGSFPNLDSQKSKKDPNCSEKPIALILTQEN